MNICIIGFDETIFEPIMYNKKIKNIYLLYKSGFNINKFQEIYSPYYNYSNLQLIQYTDIINELINIKNIDILYINTYYSLMHIIEASAIFNKKCKLYILYKNIQSYELEIYEIFFTTKLVDIYMEVNPILNIDINILYKIKEYVEYIKLYKYIKYPININIKKPKLNIKYSDVQPITPESINILIDYKFIMRNNLYWIDTIGHDDDFTIYKKTQMYKYIELYEKYIFFHTKLDFINKNFIKKKNIEFLHNNVIYNNTPIDITMYRSYIEKRFNTNLILHHINESYENKQLITPNYTETKTWNKKVDILILNIHKFKSSNTKEDYLIKIHMYINNLLEQLTYYTKRLKKGGNLYVLTYPVISKGGYDIFILLKSLFKEVYISYDTIESIVIYIYCINYMGNALNIIPLKNKYITQLYDNAETYDISKIIENIYKIKSNVSKLIISICKNNSKKKGLSIYYLLYLYQCHFKILGSSLTFVEFTKGLITGGSKYKTNYLYEFTSGFK